MEMSSSANTFIIAHPASWISPFGFQSFFALLAREAFECGDSSDCQQFSLRRQTGRASSILWLDSLISGQDDDRLCLHGFMWRGGKWRAGRARDLRSVIIIKKTKYLQSHRNISHSDTSPLWKFSGEDKHLRPVEGFNFATFCYWLHFGSPKTKKIAFFPVGLYTLQSMVEQ